MANTFVVIVSEPLDEVLYGQLVMAKTIASRPSAASDEMAYHTKVDGLPEAVGLLVLTWVRCNA